MKIQCILMVGSVYAFARACWKNSSVFLVLIVKPKSSQALENWSMLFCMSNWVLAFNAQSSAKRKSRTVTFWTFVLARSLRKLNKFPLVRYLTPISSKCVCQHSWEHHTEESEGEDTSLFDAICYWGWLRVCITILYGCLHAVMELPNHCDEPVTAAKLRHDLPKSFSGDSIKSFCQVPKNGVKADILLQALLLQFACSKDHIYCPTALPEPALTLR